MNPLPAPGPLQSFQEMCRILWRCLHSHLRTEAENERFIDFTVKNEDFGYGLLAGHIGNRLMELLLK